MKKEYDFKNAKRGLFAKTTSKQDRDKGPSPQPTKRLRDLRPRIVNVSFDVTQEVAASLRVLRDTGLYGNGVDCASVAEELLRRALLDPTVQSYWRKIQ